MHACTLILVCALVQPCITIWFKKPCHILIEGIFASKLCIYNFCWWCPLTGGKWRVFSSILKTCDECTCCLKKKNISFSAHCCIWVGTTAILWGAAKFCFKVAQNRWIGSPWQKCQMWGRLYLQCKGGTKLTGCPNSILALMPNSIQPAFLPL